MIFRQVEQENLSSFFAKIFDVCYDLSKWNTLKLICMFHTVQVEIAMYIYVPRTKSSKVLLFFRVLWIIV